MARNADDLKSARAKLRLVVEDDDQLQESDIQEFKSKFAAQMKTFADDLDARIEMIKNC